MKSVVLESIDEETLLTSRDVGLLLQVNPSSVNKWVKDGLIECFRTPGGHRRIRAADLVTFCKKQKLPVPGRLQGVSKRRLLIVDDDVKQLQGLERFLKKHSAQIDTLFVTNGVDALVEVGRFKPHFVLLDMYMPEINGLEVVRRLKANPATASIQIIFTSGNLEPGLVEEAVAAGVASVLQKPFEVDDLLRAMGFRLQPALMAL